MLQLKQALSIIFITTIFLAPTLSGGEEWNPKIVADLSPTIGFIESPDAPARLLYDRTLTDENSSTGKVRLVLEIRATQDVAIASYVAICVEAFQSNESQKSGVRKTSYYFSGAEDSDVYFDVQDSSNFTFFLESVTLQDGTVWINK